MGSVLKHYRRRQMLGRDHYQLAIDRHDAILWANIVTEDGEYQTLFGHAEGAEQRIGAITSWHCSGITKGKRHMLGPFQVEITGETATASSYYV